MIRYKFITIFLLLIIKNTLSFSQSPYTFSKDTLVIMYYNLLNFPGNTPLRVYKLRSILDYIRPDVLVVNELQSDDGANLIHQDAILFGIMGFRYQRAVFTNGPDSDNMLFYNQEKLIFHSQDTIQTALRLINHYKLYVNDPDLPQTKDTTFLNFFSLHLRSSPSETQERYEECLKLMNYISADTSLKNIFVGGDFNFYTDQEPAYNLLTNTAVEKLYDPINKPGVWSNNALFAPYHTQSPRKRAFNGGSTGGMDDRFDFIFVNDNVMNGLNRVKYVPNSYLAFGNDGLHFEDSLTAPPTNPLIPDTVIKALHDMADHLPVIMKVYLDVKNPSDIYFNKCNGILISEYLEGSSNNKGIELFNLSPLDTIDLSTYKISIYSNGSQIPTQQIPLQGKLPGHGFYILANNNSSTLSRLVSYADTFTTKINFNGNDAVALLKNDTVLDVIGEIGVDPGLGWVIDTGSTKDHTIIRKPQIKKPNNNWQSSQSEWLVKPIDDDFDINQHLSSCEDCDLSAQIILTAVRCGNLPKGEIDFYNFMGSYPPYKFTWSTGDTTAKLTGLLPGNYYFTMTDNIGCELIEVATILSLPDPIASGLTITSAGCPSDCNGSAKILVFNEQNYRIPFTYLWSDPSAQTDSIATGLCAGTYYFTFTDYYDCTDTGKVIITGDVNALSDFYFSINQNNVTFQNTSTNATSYLWNFGDGITSTEVNPVHTYTSVGTYSVLLSSTNNCGVDKLSKNITILTTGFNEENSPEIYFTFDNRKIYVKIPPGISCQNTQLSVFDIIGKKLYVTLFHTSEFELNTNILSLAPGVYFVEVKTEDKKNFINKVVIFNKDK